MLSIIDIIEDTTVDGPGFRTAIYAAGCPNKCPGCHNPESWDIHKGKKVRTEEIVEKVLADEFANVTFSGGDPMFQPEGFTEVAKAIKEKSQKTIWCYTGYKFEDLIKNPAQAALLSYIEMGKTKPAVLRLLRLADTLVDGRYVEELRDLTLEFRGSSNQRLIDVQASLNKKEIVTYKYNPFI